MKFLKILIFVVLGLIAIFVIVGLFLPSKMKVERSITIDAPPFYAFMQVDNLRNYNEWSPWLVMDPNMKIEYEGPASGVGAAYSWTSGDANVGIGKLTIAESKPYESIQTELQFADGQGQGYWKFEPAEGKTKVTWSVESDLGGNIMAKYMGVFADATMGALFEQGLQKLKKLAEQDAKNGYILSIEETDMEPMKYYFALDSSADMSDLHSLYAAAYGELTTFFETNKIKMTKPPISITRRYEEGKPFVFEAGMPADATDVEPTGRISAGEVEGGKVVKATMFGPYENMTPVYNQVFEYIRKNNLQVRGDSWEVYLNDPYTVKPEEVHTEIYVPVK